MKSIKYSAMIRSNFKSTEPILEMAVLVPFQGTMIEVVTTNPGQGFTQPWAKFSRPVGSAFESNDLTKNFRPNGEPERSPGLSNAMPWETRPQETLRPNGAREMLIV